MRHNKSQRRFLFYSLYAWTTPIIFTICTYVVDNWDMLTDAWKPNLGVNRCWFEGTYFDTFNNYARKVDSNKFCFYLSVGKWRGHVLFFILPVGVHICINSILFILTSIHCSRVKNEIHKMQSRNDADLRTKHKRYSANKAKFV